MFCVYVSGRGESSVSLMPMENIMIEGSRASASTVNRRSTPMVVSPLMPRLYTRTGSLPLTKYNPSLLTQPPFSTSQAPQTMLSPKTQIVFTSQTKTVLEYNSCAVTNISQKTLFFQWNKKSAFVV